MLKMINETVSELLISTTQEKLISLIKENPNVTQEQLAVNLGITRDGVSYKYFISITYLLSHNHTSLE